MANALKYEEFIPSRPLGWSLPNQVLEPLADFKDHFDNLRQRWNNRLVLERTSLSKAYIDGRLEIVLYGDWPITADNHVKWACRIVAKDALFDQGSSEPSVEVANFSNCDGRNDEVVFVGVFESVESPQLFIRSTFRTYLFEKKFFGSGQGLLYRREPSIDYEVFPFDAHWKNGPIFDRGGGEIRQDAVSEVVQCSAGIMDRITNNTCQHLWDWLNGPEGQIMNLGIVLDARSVRLLRADPVEGAMQGRGQASKLINVAVGSLNL